MTTLNQVFIKVYSQRDNSALGSQERMPARVDGVQLRVDVGGDPLIPGMATASIHAGLINPEGVMPGTSMQFVAPASLSRDAQDVNPVLLADAAVSSEHLQEMVPSQYYAVNHLKRSSPGKTIRWPGLCQALSQAAPAALQDAGQNLVRASREGMKYIAVTSAGSAAGTTTASICLARAAAQQGIQVALVDAHFADPRLATEMNFEPGDSWHVMTDGSQDSSRLVKEGVTFYPLQLTSDDDLTDWTCPTLLASLEQLAADQDLVVMDVGSVLVAWGYGFRRAVEAMIDSVVVVRDCRQRDVFAIDSAIDRLQRAGLEVVVAENFVSG